MPQFRSLNFLDRDPGFFLSDVAEHMGVTLTEDPQERRQVVLKLAIAGTTHIKQSHERTRDKMAAMLTRFSDIQLATLTGGLILLNEVFADESSEPGDRA